ncbi:hypothetical protein B0H13DRAFT_2670525, partial [Mycena leptocephala]
MSDFKMLLSLLPPPPTFPPAPRRALCTTVRIFPHRVIMPHLNDLASFRQASADNLHAMSMQVEATGWLLCPSRILSFLSYSLAAASSITQG